MTGGGRTEDAATPFLRRPFLRRPLLRAHIAAVIVVFGFLVLTGALHAGIALFSALALVAAIFFLSPAISQADLPRPKAGALVGAARPPEPLGSKMLETGAGIVIIDQLPDPLVLLDKTGRVLLRNKAAEPFLGTQPIGKPIVAMMRVPVLLEAVNEVLAGAAERRVEYSSPVPVERYYQALITRIIAPLRPGPPPSQNNPKETADGVSEQGESILILLHEVTAAKRVEQMRADFVANASHELKTPLASLSGFIDTLRGHARHDPQAQERFLAIMTDQAGRMRRLIDDLLSLSRIELNEHIRPRDPLGLEPLIRDVVDGLSPLAASSHVDIIINVEQPLPAIIGDRDELAQMFQNLIENALKYGKSGKRIEITLAKQTRAGRPVVATAVRDFGMGIAREHLPRLTERFYRVDPAASRERGGTGLGLAIVKHIVNRHQGALIIESDPGQGSCFTVQLPATGEGGAYAGPGRS